MITAAGDGTFLFDPGPDAELVFALVHAFPDTVPAPMPVRVALERGRTIPLALEDARDIVGWIVRVRDVLGAATLNSPDPAQAVAMVGEVSRLADRTSRAVPPAEPG